MVGKNQTIPVEIGQEELDEGWWAAVLADEESTLGEFFETYTYVESSQLI